MHISLTELRRTPAPALDHVRSGEEVIVTDEGVPFMRMVPTSRSSRYDDLMAAGVLHPPKAPRDIDQIRAASLANWDTSDE